MASLGPVVVRKTFAASRQTVWQHLTDEVLRAAWWQDSFLEPETGGQIGVKTGSADEESAPVRDASGKINIFVPKQTVSFRWRDNIQENDTNVIIMLRPDDEDLSDTVITVIESGFAGHPRAAQLIDGARQSWNSLFENLEATLLGVVADPEEQGTAVEETAEAEEAVEAAEVAEEDEAEATVEDAEAAETESVEEPAQEEPEIEPDAEAEPELGPETQPEPVPAPGVVPEFLAVPEEEPIEELVEESEPAEEVAPAEEPDPVAETDPEPEEDSDLVIDTSGLATVTDDSLTAVAITIDDATGEVQIIDGTKAAGSADEPGDDALDESGFYSAPSGDTPLVLPGPSEILVTDGTFEAEIDDDPDDEEWERLLKGEDYDTN